MVEEIIWSPRSIKEYELIIEYLTENWSDNEVRNFVSATLRTIEYVKEHPKMFRKLSKRNLHEALVTPHNLLV